MIVTNKEFAKSNEPFNLACELASVKPTKRQASKWRMQKGSAYKKALSESRKEKSNEGDS